MAKNLTSIDTGTDTFQGWINKTNAIIAFCNTEVVTANSHANGAITTGNGYVIGVFGANTLVCTEIRGGNTVANTGLTISSNVAFTANTLRIDSGITLGANSLVNDHGVRFTTSSLTAAQMMDRFPKATYRTAKYVISITDTGNSKYQATEIIVTHDGTNTYSTEYATLLSNTSLATIGTAINGANVEIQISPAVQPLEVNISRTLKASNNK